jgi:hypothetical protein
MQDGVQTLAHCPLHRHQFPRARRQPIPARQQDLSPAIRVDNPFLLVEQEHPGRQVFEQLGVRPETTARRPDSDRRSRAAR